MIAVSWDEFGGLSQKLQRMAESGSFDCIVAISRGGLVVGRLLSHGLGLPLAVVSAKAYGAGETGTSGRVTVDRKVSFVGDLGRNVLLVDDIADSGATLVAVERFLNEAHRVSVKSAVIFKKKSCKCNVDYAAESGASDWIVMPYELREFRNLKD